jgi:pSer/pThr/pTyr-binding forkhead associated (FHA) protein
MADRIWSLDVDRSLTIGRLPGADVHLEEDRFVSRAHARVWYADLRWWIEDVGSSHGTRVRGDDIRGRGAVALAGGDEILIGQTRLVFAASDRRVLRAGQASIELQVAPAVNFALHHCGMPIVELVVVQAADGPTPAARLSLDLGAYAEAHDLLVPALDSGTSTSFSRPAFSIDYGALQAQTERARWPVQARWNGELVRGDPVECWVLAHNEWSAAQPHRVSLAAFVLPNHPLIEQLVLELEPDPPDALAALHHYFSTRWRLSYREEPPHWDSSSQKIRLPHQVLLDPVERTGVGTCLDLALLYAACLENLGLQAVVAVVDMGQWWHALVGTWRVPSTGLEPIVVDRQRLLEEAHWIDATASTTSLEFRRDVIGATAEAVRILSERKLQFALDVAAARQDHITPLPFAGEPYPSPAVVGALEAARIIAEAAGAQPSGASLLLALLGIVGGLTREIVASRFGSLEAVKARIRAQLTSGSAGSSTLRRTRDLARSLARDEGSPMVLEPHLLTALLQTPSASLDSALNVVGTSRSDMLTLVARRIATTPTQYSIFSEWQPAKTSR